MVIDLGCGDFNIGRQLTDLCSTYHGCDIVEPLIEHNIRKFSQDGVAFSCIDATTQKLPQGDVLIVRQVLQHLSNAAIQKVVTQFTDFVHVILTEHIPDGDFVANIDKPSGPDSRLRLGSGVDITAPPFSLKPVSQQVLSGVRDRNDIPGTIRTIVLKMKD